MNVLHVLLHGIIRPKHLFAHLTRKVVLSSVQRQVLFQVSRVGESLLTEVTGVIIAAAVHAHVATQVGRWGAAAATETAHIGVAGVRRCVARVRRCIAKVRWSVASVKRWVAGLRRCVARCARWGLKWGGTSYSFIPSTSFSSYIISLVPQVHLDKMETAIWSCCWHL